MSPVKLGLGCGYCIYRELENSYAGMVASDTTRYLQLFFIWWFNEHLIVHTMISNFGSIETRIESDGTEYRSGRLRQQWLQSFELPWSTDLKGQRQRQTTSPQEIRFCSKTPWNNIQGHQSWCYDRVTWNVVSRKASSTIDGPRWQRPTCDEYIERKCRTASKELKV